MQIKANPLNFILEKENISLRSIEGIIFLIIDIDEKTTVLIQITI